MQYLMTFSKVQLEFAVDYISKNNPNFLEKEDVIRHAIFESMENLAKDPESTFDGTMGFILVADRSFEDLGNDENIVRFDIYVDPALSAWDYVDGDDQQFASFAEDENEC